MANISKINVSGIDYSVKDSEAREHFINYNNPHNVTAAQLELDKVENLSSEDITNIVLRALGYSDIVKALNYVPAKATDLDAKLDKNKDGQSEAIINFINGVQVGGALITYNSVNDTVNFK